MNILDKFGKKTFASLKIRNYRLYFTGQAISLCGTWMQTIGQDWLVLKLTNSGTQLGIVSAFQFLPILLFGPLGGVVADHFSKRKILYFTQSAAGILALILGLLVATATVKIWMVYLLALGLGLVNMINGPTIQTFVFEMVGKDNLANAVSLNSVEVNVARAVGPALGGAIIAAIGLAPCFFINGFSYLAVLVVLSLMNKNELSPIPRASKVKGQLMAGLRYVKSSPILLSILLMMAIIGTLSYEFSIILPLIAQFTFHGGAGTYAALVAATGVGSVVGGLFTAGRKKTDIRVLVTAALLFGFFLLTAAVMPNLYLFLAAMVCAGIFSINFISLGNTTLQLESKPEMRGRVMSLWTMAFLGSTPIGGPIIGFIGEHAGPRWGLAVGGLAAVCAAILGSLTLLKKSKPLIISEEAAIAAEESYDEDAGIPK